MEDILPFIENKIVHTEGSIVKMLHSRFHSTALYKLNNAYIFGAGWETDFFVVQRSSGYSYDIEIKVSRSDFFNDFNKKDKHSILQTGKFLYRWSSRDRQTGEWIDHIQEKEYSFRPNRFYFCVPKGMVSIEEVPKYAGLMYAGESYIEIIKEAPFIHKTKLKFDSILCPKFYWYWRESVQEVRRLTQLKEELYDEIRCLKQNLQEKTP